jgi:ribonuclease PH
MLPASTGRRKSRPAAKPDSRGIEIQRLIGRVVRNVVRFDRLGANTVHLDCDVLEADGGTRTASITGAWVALALACRRACEQGRCEKNALTGPVAAVSVGIVEGRAVLDLDYREDSTAEVDMNVAMTTGDKFVEVQGTAEGAAFDAGQLEQMLSLARRGVRKLIRAQRDAIKAANEE